MYNRNMERIWKLWVNNLWGIKEKSKRIYRKFIGIEIDPEYHKISMDRLNGILANGQISFDTDINKIQ